MGAPCSADKGGGGACADGSMRARAHPPPPAEQQPARQAGRHTQAGLPTRSHRLEGGAEGSQLQLVHHAQGVR